MKIKITFEKWSPYYNLGQKLNFYIYIKCTECDYEEFYNWLDKTEEKRLKLAEKYNYNIDISYSEKVIQLVKN